MKIIVTVRHIDDQMRVDSLKNYAQKKLKKVERYLKSKRNPTDVKIVLSAEKFRNSAEIFINSGTLNATTSVETEDMYVAVDRAVDTVVKQLRRKTDKRIRSRRRSTPLPQKETSEPEQLEEELNKISRKKLPRKPMSLEEAILQLDVAGEDFVVFRDSETGIMNVLCRRKGGRIELIVP